MKIMFFFGAIVSISNAGIYYIKENEWFGALGWLIAGMLLVGNYIYLEQHSKK